VIGLRAPLPKRAQKHAVRQRPHCGVASGGRHQNARGGGLVPPSNVKENLSPYLGSSEFLSGSLHAETTPGLSSMGVGSHWLFVPVCISTHQMFDQLLADQAILMAAPALLDGCHGLRTRSLKPRLDAHFADCERRFRAMVSAHFV
jgi:hypothetical protein